MLFDFVWDEWYCEHCTNLVILYIPFNKTFYCNKLYYWWRHDHWKSWIKKVKIRLFQSSINEWCKVPGSKQLQPTPKSEGWMLNSRTAAYLVSVISKQQCAWCLLVQDIFSRVIGEIFENWEVVWNNKWLGYLV